MTVDIENLLHQLTLDEKILLLAGKNFWETYAIDRLHIPSLKVTDGPSGARGETFLNGIPTACFPSCVSLAASFDRDLVVRVGRALAEETQAKGAYVLLGPTVCIHRSPLGGRNFESFSEDPLLSGVLASHYVKGLQSNRVAPAVKHFFANEQDTRRFTVNETISERALREIYLKPFEIVVKEAKPWALMTSYPKINGNYVDATSTYLSDVLRKEWGFDGLTMTDWGAGSTVESIRNGLDLEMPGPARVRDSALVHEALRDGRVSDTEIDERVRNLLKLLERVGKFSDRGPTPPEQAIDRPEHRALIREAGAAGVVLLKNENNVLPIDTNRTKKIALLGPLAQEASAHGGGSSFLTCHYKVSPYEAFTRALGSQVELSCSKGALIFRSLPDLVKETTNFKGTAGWGVEYFDSYDHSGEPFLTSEVPRSYFSTHDQIDIKEKAMSARMSTTYRPITAGSHYLSLSGAGNTKLYINGELVAEQRDNIPDAMAFISGVQDELRVQYPFKSAESYSICVETAMPTASISDNHILDNQLCAHVGFVLQEEMEKDLEAEAVALARGADVAIVFVGNTYQWESEGQDMNAMVLPPYNTRVQDSLVAAVAAANPNTVVVNTTGVPVELPWLPNIAGLLQVWYAGQEAGNAVLDVLIGRVSPSGKLPVSWPRLYEHTACYGNFGLDSYDTREVEYVEDVFVGYRHFDRHWKTDKEVVFPFGHGLSYTKFEISDVSVCGRIRNDPDEVVTVTAHIKNVGALTGSESLQVYVAPPEVSGVERPIKSLAGLAKVHLQPQEERVVTVEFKRDAAAFWDEGLKSWRVTPGQHTVTLATSSSPHDVKGSSVVLVEEDFTFAP